MIASEMFAKSYQDAVLFIVHFSTRTCFIKAATECVFSSLTLFVELIEASLPQISRAATELGVPFSGGDLRDKTFHKSYLANRDALSHCGFEKS